MGFCTAVREFSLFLTVNVHLASAASHSLHYFYTGVTSEIHFPEFSVVGLVDGEQFVYYDSSIRKKIPKTGWMEKSVGEDYWTRETQKAQGAQETFKASVGPIMRRFSQTEETGHSGTVLYKDVTFMHSTEIYIRQGITDPVLLGAAQWRYPLHHTSN
ncbi:hypothetical protein MHYP_G00269650 [Metynnis hypsauchen]